MTIDKVREIRISKFPTATLGTELKLFLDYKEATPQEILEKGRYVENHYGNSPWLMITENEQQVYESDETWELNDVLYRFGWDSIRNEYRIFEQHPTKPVKHIPKTYYQVLFKDITSIKSDEFVISRKPPQKSPELTELHKMDAYYKLQKAKTEQEKKIARKEFDAQSPQWFDFLSLTFKKPTTCHITEDEVDAYSIFCGVEADIKKEYGPDIQGKPPRTRPIGRP